MSITNTTENTILKMVLKGIDPSWRVGTNLYVALFTADPGETGSLAAEADYTGYVRIPLVKATDWTDNGSMFANANLIQFGACTAGNNALTHYAIVDTVSGAVNMMMIGALSATLNVSAGIQPQFPAGDLKVTVD